MKETLVNAMAMRDRGEIPAFERIIIETTGLANPASILNTIIQDVHLKGNFVVHCVTTIVDAENAMLQNKLHPEWAAQVVAAQQLLVSKTDRVDNEEVKKVTFTLKMLNFDAVIDNTDKINDIEALFTVNLVKKGKNKNTYFMFRKQEQQLHAEIKTVSIEFEKPINWLAFGLWLNLLLNKHGENILRVKRIINLIDNDFPILIQGVQHCIYPPQHLAEWPWQDRMSRIVFITRHINVSNLQNSFHTFMSNL